MRKDSRVGGKRIPILLISTWLILWVIASVAWADVRLPSFFSDHMVLQQGKKIAVWGWAAPGERVDVALGSTRASSVTDSSGRWIVHLAPQRVGGPRELVVKSRTGSITIRDVLIGEVWLCSGQSNMQFALRSTSRAALDLPQANHPEIRLLHVPKSSILEPSQDTQAKWEVCTPDSARDFSAVAYYFGLELQKRLKAPVGLIASSWGGTNAEEWTSPGFLASDPHFQQIHDRWKNSSSDNQIFFSQPLHFDVSLDDVRLIPRSEGGLAEFVDDFRDGDLNTMTGGAWSLGESQPASRFSLAPGSDQTLRVSGDLRVSDQAILQLLFDRSRSTRDLSAFRGLSFRVRGRGYLRVHSLQPTIADWDNYTASPIAVTDEWQTVTVEFDSLRQAGWGVKLPFTPDSLTGLLFEFIPGLFPVVRPPSGLYNGMIAPLVPYTLRGFAWYQGEGNAGRSYQYRKLLPALIRSWRSAWKDAQLPFLIVQLPNYRERKEQPGESGWAELREAQLLTLQSVPGTGMAVTIDLGRAEDVHPKDKSEVGRRLALWALGGVYKQPLVYSGPICQSSRKQGQAIVVGFDHAGGGLIAKDGQELRGFVIAGADRKFHWARARIIGNQVEVSAAAVADPVAVRYAWADNPDCNLYNKEGLPASPFRTDDWPGITFLAR